MIDAQKLVEAHNRQLREEQVAAEAAEAARLAALQPPAKEPVYIKVRT